MSGTRVANVLMKRSKKQLMGKQWVSRKVQLRGRLLALYRQPSDTVVKDAVVVNSTCSVAAWNDATRPFGVCFRSPARTWVFVVDTQADQDAWIAEVSSVVLPCLRSAPHHLYTLHQY